MSTKRKKTRVVKRYKRNYNTGYSTKLELKFHDSEPTDALVSNTGTVQTSLNLIAQGITESTRIGRLITVRSIGIRMVFNLALVADQADVPDGDILRVLLFIDHQANGAQAAVLDILEAAVHTSFRNLGHSKRFTILMDRWFVLNRKVSMTDGTNTASSPEFTQFFKYYRKVNIPIEFDSTTGVIGEVTSNNIGLLYISENGLVGVDRVNARLRYTG